MLASLIIAAALPVLQNIRDLTNADISTRVFFDVTGRILGIDGSRFVAEDETGRAFFNGTTTDFSPNPGDRVRLSGYTFTGPDRYRHLTPTNIVRLATGTPPVPRKTTLAAVARGDCDYLPVTVRGIITDIHSDELEDGIRFMTLRDGSDFAVIPLRDRPNLPSLLGAEVSVTGLCSPKSLGWRLFASRCISPSGNGIAVLKPAPADLLSVPPLGDPFRTTPQALSGLGYRRPSRNGPHQHHAQQRRLAARTGSPQVGGAGARSRRRLSRHGRADARLLPDGAPALSLRPPGKRP